MYEKTSPSPTKFRHSSIVKGIDTHILNESTGDSGAKEQGQYAKPRLGDGLLRDRGSRSTARRRRGSATRLRSRAGGLTARHLGRGRRGLVVVAEGVAVVDAVAGQAAAEVAHRLLLRETVQAAVVVVLFNGCGFAALVHHIGVVAPGRDGAGGVSRGDFIELGAAVGGGWEGRGGGGSGGHFVGGLLLNNGLVVWKWIQVTRLWSREPAFKECERIDKEMMDGERGIWRSRKTDALYVCCRPPDHSHATCLTLTPSLDTSDWKDPGSDLVKDCWPNEFACHL